MWGRRRTGCRGACALAARREIVLRNVHLLICVRARARARARRSALLGFSWAGYHWTLEGTAFFLQQRSAGGSAVRRSVLRGACTGLITWVLVTLSYRYGRNLLGIVALCTWNVVLMALYSAFVCLPPTMLHRRPALRTFAIFFVIVHATDLVGNALFYWSDLGLCLELFAQWVVIGVAEPFIVYNAMLRDSMYWQGVAAGDETEVRQVQDIHRPLIGLRLSMRAAAGVADAVDALELNTVPLLDCHKIVLEGAGERVMAGTWRRAARARLLAAAHVVPRTVARHAVSLRRGRPACRPRQWAPPPACTAASTRASAWL